MTKIRTTSLLAYFLCLGLSTVSEPAGLAQMAAFPLNQDGPVISRPVQTVQPFTVAGERGVVVGTQDGAFEAWVLPVKLLSHLSIKADVAGYSVPIAVNQQAAQIEVRPDRTTITYAHIGFTLRQIMFASDAGVAGGNAGLPSTGPVVLFQVDSDHAVDLTFRFTPEMRWMWPKRNDGIPGAGWVSRPGGGGYYVLAMDYPDLAGAVTIPGATPGIMAPYQERPQVHPLELHLHYDPKRDGQGAAAKYFPLLMAVGTTVETAKAAALGETLAKLEASIPEVYAARAAGYKKLLEESTSIETPDKALNEAFRWGVVSIEQLKAHAFGNGPEGKGEDALVAGYYSSADSARPGFGWFFGRDALYTLYAVNGYGDFALSRAELEFLMARQRADGKIMHEFAQTAGDPAVKWKDFPYMYAAADATPLFLMAVRDYYRASGDVEFLKAHREAIEKAWGFETAATSDTDHDGIYDNSQGTGWVESWPHDKMPHQEVYLALLDEQASLAYADLERAFGDATKAGEAVARSTKIQITIESEYYDSAKGCYAFSHNLPGDLNGETDKSSTVYPAIGWWDDPSSQPTAFDLVPPGGAYNRALPRCTITAAGRCAPELKPASPLAHPAECLKQWAGPAIATDWGLRDVASTEPFYDGMSYHQGSVWPLFTGWGAMAEYRAEQSLAGEQMLMQNVDLTWAQDPGAVTELLSGDYFVPFGRSTSHQLWSSAMVITPVLRGLFGISLDAAANTITVNPRLPAHWGRATVRRVRFAGQLIDLAFTREHGAMRVEASVTEDKSVPSAERKSFLLRSDLPGTKLSVGQPTNTYEISVPLPVIEFDQIDHALPTPGSRPAQIKITSVEYGVRNVRVVVQGQPDSDGYLWVRRNRLLIPKLDQSDATNRPGSTVNFTFVDTAYADVEVGLPLTMHFPKGDGWQTLTFGLAW